MADLLAPGGLILVELDPPGCGERALRLRLEGGGEAGEWFAWARVAVDALDAPAAAAGLAVADAGATTGGWFAAVTRP